jgi:hypothetical protein
MTLFRRSTEGLQCHDCSVHHARPYGEPDDALMRVRIARRRQKEYAERRLDSDDHHQVVRVPLTPCPAGGPDNAQRIDAENESKPDDDQRDAEVKQTTGRRHCAPPMRSDVFSNVPLTRRTTIIVKLVRFATSFERPESLTTIAVNSVHSTAIRGAAFRSPRSLRRQAASARSGARQRASKWLAAANSRASYGDW